MNEPAVGQRRVRALAGLLTIFAATLLVVLVYLVQRSSDERDHALARAQHSFAVVLLINQTQGAMAHAEAALGRFMIDADPRTGQAYYDDWREAGGLLDRLELLVADNPAQVRRVDRLRQLYLRRGRELAAAATRASYKQGMPALSFYYKAARSPVLPDIARLLQQIASAEDILLGHRVDTAAVRVDRSNDLTRTLSLVGVLLALSVIALAWQVASALAERRLARDAAEMEADRSFMLEQAVLKRTSELSEANTRLRAAMETRAAAEAKLRQMQKMDAVGQLTGGIAHDFNNMLAVVLGGLEMAKRRLDEQAAETGRHIDQALEGAERAAALTRRLLSFARAEPLLPAAVRPAALLTGMTDLVDRTIGERIVVDIAAAPDVWPIWVDGFQLENALLNLAVNARDAMDGTGALTVRAENARLAAGEVGALGPGEYVRIAVADTGCGMAADVVERVFEPFFTTKPVGQGTGLGLSQILGFARQSGGDVAIASTPGTGTIVSIYLPRHHAVVAAPELSAPARAPRPPAVPAGRVLMVEDDARVRLTTAQALDELGCTVESCASGADALARLETMNDVALLMTDVVMPAMNGIELVRLARRARPELPVLFVTGYVGEAGDADAFNGFAVLRKPFTLGALSDALAVAQSSAA